MFCLKCGKPVGGDSEFCDAHADDPVTEQSLQAEAEELEKHKHLRTCPACNQLVYMDQSKCPSCGHAFTARQ